MATLLTNYKMKLKYLEIKRDDIYRKLVIHAGAGD